MELSTITIAYVCNNNPVLEKNGNSLFFSVAVPIWDCQQKKEVFDVLDIFADENISKIVEAMCLEAGTPISIGGRYYLDPIIDSDGVVHPVKKLKLSAIDFYQQLAKPDVPREPESNRVDAGVPAPKGISVPGWEGFKTLIDTVKNPWE